MTPAHERLLALWLSRRPQRDERLVAFVVAESTADCDSGALRVWLGQRLPHWMVPSRFVVVPDLPRTPSGKIQRSALQAPLPSGSPAPEVVPPRTPLEMRLAALFAEVLGAPPASVYDDFFADLGGHSLVATQLASAMRQEWRIELPLRQVFESPTVAGLAEHVERAASAGASRPTIPRRGGDRDEPDRATLRQP